MAMVHQEIDAVLLGLDRVIDGTRPENLEISHADFDAAGGTRVEPHFPGYADGRFLRELSKPVPGLRRDGRLHHDGLERPGAIAHDDERDLARGPDVCDPT